MPYIDQNTRAYIAPSLNRLLQMVTNTSEGVLNYIITRLLLGWLGPHPDYSRFNAAIGVLRCAEAEFYRHMVAPYEDVKRGESGDVYPPILDHARVLCTLSGGTCTCKDDPQ